MNFRPVFIWLNPYLEFYLVLQKWFDLCIILKAFMCFKLVKDLEEILPFLGLSYHSPVIKIQ